MAIAEQEAEGCGLMVDVTDSQLETEAEQRMKKREREREKENSRNVPDRAPQANIQNASTLRIVQNKSYWRFL